MIFARLRKKSPIGSLKEGGMATIKGVLKSEGSLMIPPSGTRCAYYALMEERYGKGQLGRGRPLWFPSRMERKTGGLSVADETGTISLEASGEKISIASAHREEGLVKGNRKRRFFAEYLFAEDKVIVRGRVERSPSGEGFILCAPPKGMLKIVVVEPFVPPS